MSDSEKSENEQVGNEEDILSSRNKLPVIQPIQNKPPKKRIYTRTTDKMRERNLAASKKAQEVRKANKAKLAEYELLKSMKTISKEDAEELLNTRFNALEEKLKKLTEKPEPIPETEKVLPSSTSPGIWNKFPLTLNDIKEEPEDTAYLSSSSVDSQKRTSSRFIKRDTSPQVSRLSERFKRF